MGAKFIKLIILCLGLSAAPQIAPAKIVLPYDAFECYHRTQPAMVLSTQNRAKDKTAPKIGTIPLIAKGRAILDVQNHIIEQCNLRHQGKAYSKQCAVGKTIFLDEYFVRTFAEFGDLEKTKLAQERSKMAQSIVISKKAMNEACTK